MSKKPVSIWNMTRDASGARIYTRKKPKAKPPEVEKKPKKKLPFMGRTYGPNK